MSKEAAASPAPAAEPEAAKKSKMPIKTIAVVLVVMIAEAAALLFLIGLKAPKASEGAETHDLKPDQAAETQEILVAEDKFQNLQTGRVWLWDAAVYVQVKAMHAERIEKTLEQRNAEIKEGVSQIMSRAQHAQLKEPERQTLNLQLTAYLQKVFGSDAQGKSLVERVLIPRCRGFPAGF
ncbi:MAG: hypothetical protein JNM07_02770 [Phycisphaerae bacterium]|nr:hypothetical protein [Phycisphaerae bacterium]